jgi:hypothetical protein
MHIDVSVRGVVHRSIDHEETSSKDEDVAEKCL